MARLEGWARPTDYLFLEHVPGGADHTYVVSSGGERWGCGGGTDGGSVVASGEGSHTLARKLARNNYGGMVYGVIGVCHQMANRVLYPCGQNVHRAKGAGWSYTAFGVYGEHNSWIAWRAACEAETGRLPNPLPIPLPPIPRPPRIPRPRWPRFAFNSGLDLSAIPEDRQVALWAAPDEAALTFSQDDWQGQEMFAVGLLTEAAGSAPQQVDDALLESFVRVRTDSRIEDSKVLDVLNARREMENARWKLIQSYNNGELTKPEFVKRYGVLLTATFARVEQQLGRALYEQIYDLPPDHSPRILNPEAIELSEGPDNEPGVAADRGRM